MQSVEYVIVENSPKGVGKIENIMNINKELYWETDEGDVSLKLELEESIISEIQIYVSTNVSVYAIGFTRKNDEVKLLEEKVPGNNKAHTVKVNNNQRLTKCSIDISTEESGNLRIYSIILKTLRENEGASTSKVVQSTLPFSGKFYDKSNGKSPSKPLVNPVSKSSITSYLTNSNSANKPYLQSNEPKYNSAKKTSNLSQTTLFGNTKPDTPFAEKNLDKLMETPGFVDEQRKMFENIQNNRQRTLRSYPTKQKVVSCSYQNLLLEEQKGNFVCCKDRQEIVDCVKEVCEVLGVEYCDDFDGRVTYLIYEGDDVEILALAQAFGAKIVMKEWLFDCCSKHEALSPDKYRRHA